MTASSPVHVGAVLFEGFDLLDFYGPLEMFGLMEGDARITVVAEKAGSIKSSAGPCGIAEATLSGLFCFLVSRQQFRLQRDDLRPELPGDFRPAAGLCHPLVQEIGADDVHAAPARIGRVRFSKTGKMLYYGNQKFQSLSGTGFKSNYYDVDTGEDYWISGPRKDGADRLYGERIPIEIDEDVREEYWRDIRRLPDRVSDKVA